MSLTEGKVFSRPVLEHLQEEVITVMYFHHHYFCPPFLTLAVFFFFCRYICTFIVINLLFGAVLKIIHCKALHNRAQTFIINNTDKTNK